MGPDKGKSSDGGAAPSPSTSSTPTSSSPFSSLVSTLFQMPSAGAFVPAAVNASAHVQAISSDGGGEGKSEDGGSAEEPEGADTDHQPLSEIEDVEDENEWSDDEPAYVRPEESEVAPPTPSRRRPRTFREREEEPSRVVEGHRDMGDREKEGGEKGEEEQGDEEVRRYKLRAVLLQDELFRTRQLLQESRAREEALQGQVVTLSQRQQDVALESALEQQRRQYEGVVRTVSAECEALQGALAERDDQLDRTLQRLSKWKRRYKMDVKALNEEVVELDEVLYQLEKDMESSSALWSATEMKYRKQMLAMRKRNMELLEKLKEVSAMEAESLEVIDRLKQQVSSTMSSLRNCRTNKATSSKKPQQQKEGEGDVLEAAEEALRKEVSRLREALEKSQKRARANVQGLQDVQDRHEQELRDLVKDRLLLLEDEDELPSPSSSAPPSPPAVAPPPGMSASSSTVSARRSMAGIVGARRPGTADAFPAEEEREEEEEEEEDCGDCVVPFEEEWDGEEGEGEEEEEEEEGPVSSGGQISGSASRIDPSLIRGGKVESQQWTGRRGRSGREAVARLCERLPCLGAFAVMEMGAELPGLFED